MLNIQAAAVAKIAFASVGITGAGRLYYLHADKVNAVALKAMYVLNLVVGLTFNATLFSIGFFLGALHPEVLNGAITEMQELVEKRFKTTILLTALVGFYALPIPFLVNSVFVGHHLGEMYRRGYCGIS